MGVPATASPYYPASLNQSDKDCVSLLMHFNLGGQLLVAGLLWIVPLPQGGTSTCLISHWSIKSGNT